MRSSARARGRGARGWVGCRAPLALFHIALTTRVLPASSCFETHVRTCFLYLTYVGAVAPSVLLLLRFTTLSTSEQLRHGTASASCASSSANSSPQRQS